MYLETYTSRRGLMERSAILCFSQSTSSPGSIDTCVSTLRDSERVFIFATFAFLLSLITFLFIILFLCIRTLNLVTPIEDRLKRWTDGYIYRYRHSQRQLEVQSGKIITSNPRAIGRTPPTTPAEPHTDGSVVGRSDHPSRQAPSTPEAPVGPILVERTPAPLIVRDARSPSQYPSNALPDELLATSAIGETSRDSLLRANIASSKRIQPATTLERIPERERNVHGLESRPLSVPHTVQPGDTIPLSSLRPVSEVSEQISLPTMPMPPGPPPDPEMPRTLETEGTERNIIGLGLTAGSHRTSLTSTSGEIHIYNEGRIIGLAADIAAPGECQLTLEAPIPQPSSPVISATTSTPSGTTTPEVPSPTVLEHEVAVSGIPTPTSPSPIAQKGTNGTSSISMPVRRQEQTEHNLSVSTDSPVPGDTPRRPESAKGFLSIDTEANISFRY